MNVNEIMQAIQNWKDLINSFYAGNPNAGPQILNYLKQGDYFEIQRSDYNSWRKINPSFIHCYVGIGDDNKLKFFLIDSVNDRKGNFENTIFDKDFQQDGDQGDHDITAEEVVERKTNWQQFDQQWLSQIDQNTNPIFRAVQIAFSDYNDIFSTPTNQSKNFFGLRNSESQSFDYDIEIIISTLLYNVDELEYSVDVTKPIPPFSRGEGLSDYKLLI